jgi:hypothetical protein
MLMNLNILKEITDASALMVTFSLINQTTSVSLETTNNL